MVYPITYPPDSWLSSRATRSALCLPCIPTMTRAWSQANYRTVARSIPVATPTRRVHRNPIHFTLDCEGQNFFYLESDIFLKGFDMLSPTKYMPNFVLQKERKNGRTIRQNVIVFLRIAYLLFLFQYVQISWVSSMKVSDRNILKKQWLNSFTLTMVHELHWYHQSYSILLNQLPHYSKLDLDFYVLW